MIWYVIPARKGSKGFKCKNRYLFDYTLLSLPNSVKHKIILTTDDFYLLNKVSNTNIITIHRNKSLSADKVSIKNVMNDVITKAKIPKSDDVMLLYLTYPERTWKDICKIYDFYQKNNCDSLLCCKKAKTHPYLCYQKTNKHFGKSIIKHDLYRRQDYPECFEISHFLCIFKSRIISQLNKQLIHKNTYFYKIDDTIDVDNMKDYLFFKEKCQKKLK